MRRLRSHALVVLLAVLGTAAAAWAFYSTAGSGSASGTVGSISAAQISVPASSAGSHAITWDTQASLSDSSHDGDIKYRVQRKLDAGAFANVSGGPCSGELPRPTTTCTDTVDTAGDYTYRVIATYKGWAVTSNAAGPVAVTLDGGTAPTQPTSVALANGGGVGGAYVNDTNKAALSVQVGLPASSSASDTVHVTITDGTNTTTDRTAAATAGAGNVTVTGIDAGGLTDGSISLRASASNGAGTSSQATADVTRDTVKPTSQAQVVANITSGNAFSVPYTAGDATPSSTLDKVDLYVDPPGGGTDFSLASTDSTPSASGESLSYAGATTDGTYGFYMRATDKAGNVEDAPGAADQTATRDTKPASPTSVALANGGGVGNAYVNGANRASLSVQVALPASSSATDTVHVVVTDGASHSTADRTVAATDGAGTVTVAGIDASGLDDGSVTLRATSSNASGSSAAKTGSVTKDTVKPSSEVTSVANITSGTTFTVNYSSADAAPSSTLDKVDLYVDDPGAGGFTLTNTVSNPAASGSIAYTGATQDGSYGFYTRATDKAGNVEDAPAGADKTATRTTPPAVAGATFAKTEGLPNSTAGYIRASAGNLGTYRIYAAVTAGTNSIATVTANISGVFTGGSTVLSLSPCSANCTVNGVTYNYVSAQQTATATGAGTKGFAVTATDSGGLTHTLGTTATSSALTVEVDNTRPGTPNGNGAAFSTSTVSPGTVGRPEAGDKITFTYDEPIDGISVVSSWLYGIATPGWTVNSQDVRVRFTNGTPDGIAVQSADGSTALFGTFAFNTGSDYVTGGDVIFGGTGATTPSTISRSGNALTVTLGSVNGGTGTVNTDSDNQALTWTPNTGAGGVYDRAGNITSSAARTTGNNTKQF